MIRRIRPSEYLTDVRMMTEEERKKYLKRVGEWLAGDGKRLLEMTDRPMAKAQNIMMLSVRWGREDCEAFYEGTLLLSARAGVTDTWLPTQLYAKSAYRAVRQMVRVFLMGSVKGSANGLIALVDPVTGAPTTKNDSTVAGQPKKPLPTIKTVSREYDAATDTVRVQCEVVPANQPSTVSHQPSSGLVPARPRHIDQYVHLLPQKTQERAAQVKVLLRELDESRENARLLMEAGEHSDKIELWARKATRLDSAVKSIYRELDSEWGKLVKQGRVVVDDLGNAHVIESEKFLDGPSGKAERRVKSEESAAETEEPAELTSEQKARRRELRKFLTDTRRGNGKTREEHIGKWQEAWKEYLTLESKDKALADQKILEAMKHYRIEIS